MRVKTLNWMMGPVHPITSRYLIPAIRTSVVFMFAVLVLFSVGSGIAYGGDETGLPADVDRYVADLVEEGFSGAVLIAEEGNVLVHEGYGLSDTADDTAVTAETVFLMGSVSKQFTAAAVLRLEMDGLLRVNDRIDSHLNGVPDDKRLITIHQLLTHSSGLQKHSFRHDFVDVSREAAVEQILSRDLLFEPGTGVSYSDDGYKILAAIIEVVSGRSWEQYLRSHLFVPAGLNDTGFFDEPRWSGRNVATGYRAGRDEGAPSEWPGPFWALKGAGGVMSTVGDLFRWWQALEDGEVLSDGQVVKMWTPYEHIGGRASFGYAWVIVEADGETFVEITGAGSSHNAYFHATRGDGPVVIVASNRIDIPLIARLGLIQPGPQEVLYAVEVGDALVENVSAGGLGTLPPFAQGGTRPFRPTILGYLVTVLTMAVLVSASLLVMKRRGRT
jgi:CubicO group peptidase (beta-lactamase class C family)